MPTFKVTLYVSDSLTLGSILMTKGVELLHITEEVRITKMLEKKTLEPKLIEHRSNGEKRSYVHFKHPSGKTLQTILVEHIRKDAIARYKWRDLSHLAVSEGFNKSSINNAIARMLHAEQVSKVGTGEYVLVRK